MSIYKEGFKAPVYSAPPITGMDRDQAAALKSVRTEYHTDKVPATLPPHSGQTLQIVPEEQPKPFRKEIAPLSQELPEILANMRMLLLSKDVSPEYKNNAVTSLLMAYSDGSKLVSGHAESVIRELLTR
jgi:hypothetical protein